jgi:hypothetical protein
MSKIARTGTLPTPFPAEDEDLKHLNDRLKRVS